MKYKDDLQYFNHTSHLFSSLQWLLYQFMLLPAAQEDTRF